MQPRTFGTRPSAQKQVLSKWRATTALAMSRKRDLNPVEKRSIYAAPRRVFLPPSLGEARFRDYE